MPYLTRRCYASGLDESDAASFERTKVILNLQLTCKVSRQIAMTHRWVVLDRADQRQLAASEQRTPSLDAPKLAR